MTGVRISSLRSHAARLLIVASLIALPSGAGAAYALADSGNTSAVAVNTTSGSSVFKLAFAIDKVAGSSVTNQNAAIAYSSCTACQTVAISIQILLIAGSPTTFTPTNVAIAINQNCTLCDTLAAAYQFAVGIGTQLRFTGQGRREIAAIHRQLEALRQSGLTGPQIGARVSALMADLGEVLRTQVVPVGPPAGRGPGGGQQGPPPPSTSPTTSTTPATTTVPPTTSTTPPATSTTPPPSTTTTPSTTSTTPTGTTSTPATTTP